MCIRSSFAHACLQIIETFVRTGSVSRVAGSGRPRKTSSQTDRMCMWIRKCQADGGLSAEEILKSGPRVHVSRTTVSRRLHEAWLHSKRRVRKAYIWPYHACARFAFAKRHLRAATNFNSVVFSDEKRYVRNHYRAASKLLLTGDSQCISERPPSFFSGSS